MEKESLQLFYREQIKVLQQKIALTNRRQGHSINQYRNQIRMLEKKIANYDAEHVSVQPKGYGAF